MTDSRRQFLKHIGGVSAASFFSVSALWAFEDNKPHEGFVSHEEEQETYLIGPRRAPVTLIVNKRDNGIDTLSFCREEIVPNDGIPVHKHLHEDELIYIQYGSGLFTLGEKQFPVKAGSVAYVPKGVWHGLINNGSADLRMLFSFTPSGFENYFREIGTLAGQPFADKTKEEWAAIDKKYGIVYKGR